MIARSSHASSQEEGLLVVEEENLIECAACGVLADALYVVDNMYSVCETCLDSGDDNGN